jgi:RNA polymerase sigma-70 factor (ECF subfamily)
MKMKEISSHEWTQIQPQLKGFVLRRVRDRAVSDDLVQEIYLKARAKLGQLHDGSKLGAWLFSIARNTITDYFRKNAKRPDLTELHWESEQRPLVDCVADCIQEALADLPPSYREALELAEMQNVPQTELAARLDISYSGAKSRVQRARQMLRSKMDERYKIEMDRYGNVLVCKSRTPCTCSEKSEDCL